MVFLETTRKNGRAVNKLEPNFDEDFMNLILYLSGLAVYFVKKNIGKILLVTVTCLLIYAKLRKKIEITETTEMIEGMEVPALKDNYDLSLD